MTKYILLTLTVFGALSCSRLDVAVNWADTYIVSQVDDYFDLTSVQSKELKNSLQDDIRRLRKEKFPKWAQSLRNLEKDLSSDKAMSKEQFHKYFEMAMEEGRSVGPYLTQTMLQFVGHATPEQLEHFQKAVREKNVEDHQKIQNSKKAREESRKKYLRGTDMWIESLTDDQDQLLNRHLSDHPFPAEKQLKNKIYILDKFNEARKSSESMKTFITEYSKSRSKFNSPEYQPALDEYQQELEKFVYQLLQSLTPAQKKLLHKNLLEKAAVLEKIAAKP